CWALLLGAFTVGFAIAPGTGVFEVALHLPGFAWFRVPHRILAVTDFCFAIGSAASLAALLDGRGRLAPIIGTVALVLGWLAARQQIPQAWLVAGCFAALVGLAFVPNRWIQSAVAAGVVGLAIYVIFQVPPRGLAMPYTAESVAIFDRQRSLYTELASRLGPDRFWLIPPSPPPYEYSFKQATRLRLRTIDDYEPFALRRQAEYLTYFYRGQTMPSRANETFAGSWLDLNPAPRRLGAKTRRRLLDL